MVKKHCSITTTIKLNGINVAEPETTAPTFNFHFNRISVTLSDNINYNLTTFESYIDDQIPESANSHQTSILEKTKIIKNLQNNNNVECDNISTNIIKTNVMTQKKRKNLPIFKTKYKLNITNYQPMFILPAISKVMKKFFYSRIYDSFSTNNILSSSQFSSWLGASTEDTQLKFTEYILKCFNDKQVEIATFMDLSKTFDCVDQDVVLTMKYNEIKSSNMVCIHTSTMDH